MTESSSYKSKHAGAAQVLTSGFGDNFRGITKQLAALRHNPRLQCKGKWCNNGRTRSPLMEALLRLRGGQPTARSASLATSGGAK